jgi:DNA-binding MarR family transcriptional regulator
MLVDLIYRLKASCIAGELDLMAEAGLSPAEYNGIAAMESGETFCGSDISLKMNLSPSRASRVIEQMVQKGYFKRETDTADRRKCNITLADKGIQLKKQIQEARKTCETRIREKLTQQEIDALSVTLEKIIQVM